MNIAPIIIGFVCIALGIWLIEFYNGLVRAKKEAGLSFKLRNAGVCSIILGFGMIVRSCNHLVNIIIISSLFASSCCLAQDCKNFRTGVFNNETEFGNVTIERLGNFQLEKTEYITIYLQKIEKKSECIYVLKRYKIISAGDLPSPNMNESIEVKIKNVEGNNFTYQAVLIGSDLKIEGVFTKISENISDEFKKILSSEK